MSVKSEKRGKKMIFAFGSGRTVPEICREFGVSESTYYALISKFPELRRIAKERVKKKLLQKVKLREMKLNRPKVDTSKDPRKRRTSE